MRLRRGATVLLYTDGLVERRGEDLDVGLDRLRAGSRRLADGPLGPAVDALVADLLPSSPEDDVVVLAMRLTG